MYLENRILFSVLLFGCAWQDIRRRTVSARLCIGVGILSAMMEVLCRSQWNIWEVLCGVSVGLAILGVHIATDGAVGEGDGWFFVVAGILLGFWQNLALLLYGLSCCSLAGCAAACLNGLAHKGQCVRKMRLPFIPFLLPAGIWMVVR